MSTRERLELANELLEARVKELEDWIKSQHSDAASILNIEDDGNGEEAESVDDGKGNGQLREYDFEANHKRDADLNIYPSHTTQAVSRTDARKKAKRWLTNRLRDEGRSISDYRIIVFRADAE